VVVEAQTEGRARAVETVTASFDGEEPGIAFNPQYLLDGLTAAASAAAPPRSPADQQDSGATPATIRLEFTSPAKPALITGVAPDQAKPPAFRYLVVPLRSPTRA
jgi:DNA polymerase-3 subunit beta